MPRSNKLDSTLERIEPFFDNKSTKSFTEKTLKEIITQNKFNWNIPIDKSTSYVINYLIKKGKFTSHIFFDQMNKKKIVYSWKTDDEYTIITGIKSNSYYSYYSSLFLHQLTLQIPKTLYLNFEHPPILNPNIDSIILTQELIDNAFKNSQRKSSLLYSFRDKKIIITNGKFTGKLGVVKYQSKNQCFNITDLERTLIDIVVRPVYAGGIFEVIEAYKIAKGSVDIKKLSNYLEQLNYIYPYHQAIGFYLEKANYNESEISFLRKEMKFNFHLTYDIRNKAFSEEWKLYYPKGI